MTLDDFRRLNLREVGKWPLAPRIVILTLLVLTPLFAPLPKAALAGVIIVVGAGLLDPAGFRELAGVGGDQGDPLLPLVDVLSADADLGFHDGAFVRRWV